MTSVVKGPAISIVSPCYNTARYVPYMVDSLLAQDFTDWELILLDDGSTDNTQQVFNKIAVGPAGNRAGFCQHKHIGCAGALAAVIRLATSPIVTFVGSDDTLKPGALSAIVRYFADHPEIGYAWFKWVRENGQPGWSGPPPAGKTFKEALLGGWWRGSCHQVFRRDLYLKTPGLDPAIPLAADLQLAALFAELGCGVAHVPTVTYVYRNHSTQSSKIKRGLQHANSKEVLARLKAGGFECRS